MGSVIAKPPPPPPSLETSDVEISPSSKNLQTNNTEVVSNINEFDHVKNTFFTKTPLRLEPDRNKKLLITVSDGTVLRIGLTLREPEKDDFVESAIFEEEDGFETGTSERSIYLNSIKYLFYGEPGKEREYLSLDEGDVWIYFIVIFGSPRISAVYDNQAVTWTHFEDSHIGITDDESTAVCGLITDAEKCISSKPINIEHTYLLQWDMGLRQNEKNKKAGKYPEYGFIRVALVDKKPRDIGQLQINDRESMDQSVVWCASCAIRDFPYSGTLAFHVCKEEGEIDHNIGLSSVDYVTTGKCLDLQNDVDLYLVVELSLGSLKIEHGHNVEVRQSYGSILYLKNCQELPNETAIRNRIETTGHVPCVIMYGSDPTSFVMEFRDKFTVKDIRIPGLTDNRNIIMLGETKAIQVIDVPSDLDGFNLNSFFSRETACGGDEIVHINQVETMKSTWIIEYRTASVARKVLTKKSYGVEGNILTVLPYYPVLGYAINKGSKPQFDSEPFSIQLYDNGMLDGCQIHFLTTRESEINALKQHMAKKVKVEVSWKRESDSDSDSNEDDDQGEIHIKCLIPRNEHLKLISWKDDARAELERYFQGHLQEKNVIIEKERWNHTIQYLQNLSEEFEFVEGEENYTIRLVASKSTNLSKIASEIGKISIPEKHKTVNLSPGQSEKYFSLEAGNKTQELKEKYTGIRLSVDRENIRVSYDGPESEVDAMHRDILQLMLKVKYVNARVKKETVKVAKKMEDQFIQKLYQNDLKGPVKFGRSITVSMYLEDVAISKEKEQVLDKCIRETVKTCDVTIRSTSIIADMEFNTFKAKEEKLYGASISLDKNNSIIKIYAWFDQIESVQKDTQIFLNSNEVGVDTEYVTQDAAEYVNKWKMDELKSAEKPIFEVKGKFYTGKVLIKGVNDAKGHIKHTLLKESKQVKVMWLMVSKPWLASLIESMQLKRIVQEHQCLLSVDNASSLAEYGISAVSILTSQCNIVKAVHANILKVNAEAIVNIAMPDLTASTGIAREILKAGGSVITHECKNYIAKYDNVSEGQAIITSSGQLSCRVIVHAVGPQKQSNNKMADADLLEKTIKCALEAADKEGVTSVAIPSFTYISNHIPIADSCERIVKAVKEHLQQKSGFNTVYLCDLQEDMVKKFVDAMKDKLKNKEWKFFQHKRKLKQLAIDEIQSRPKSARPRLGGRQNTSENFDDAMRWNPRIPEHIEEDDTNLETEEDTVHGNSFRGGLPYVINLSRNLRLHIIKGSIEKQEVDVIVCPTFHFPDLSGAVANTIQNAAGPSFSADCQQMRSLDIGEVKHAAGGGLPSANVYLVKIETGWQQRTFSIIYDTVKKALQSASQYKCKSIAFPTFGTGQSKYPADKVVEAINKAVNKFGSKSPRTSLTDVYIVVYAQDYGLIKTIETYVPTLYPARSQATTSHTRNAEDNTQNEKLKVAKFVPSQSRNQNNSDEDVVLFKIVSQKPCATMETAVQDLIDSEFVEKELSFNFDHMEEALSNDEKTMIGVLVQKYRVNHSVITVNGKPVLKIMGLRRSVNNALPNLQDLVIRTIPDVRLKKKMGVYIAQNVQWLYDDRGTKKEVNQDSNLELYIGYLKGKNFKYKNGSTEFEVDVDNLEEYPVKHPNQKRRLYLRNKIKTGTRVPDSWSIALNDKTMVTVDLDANDREFQDVKTELLNAGCKPTQIFKIFRIENRSLWMQYQSKKEQINRQNGSQNNEKKLWHGTDAATYKQIMENGYDRSFVGKNANYYGMGAYFAVRSSYSHGFAVKDGNNVQRMFYNDVLTGHSTTVAADVGVLPERKRTANEIILYDSAVNKMKNPDMYIIFHDTQAYPTYLIEFTS